MNILEPCEASHPWFPPFAVRGSWLLRQMTLVCLLTLFSLCLFTRQGFALEEKNEEVTAIALRHWPPQYLTDTKTGKPSGFAIEVMDEVARLCRLRVRYEVYPDWPEAFAALGKGQAILAPNMGRTADRLHLYDFTTPYETFRISIFVRRDSVGLVEETDLAGKKVGVVKKNQGLTLMQEKGGTDLQLFDSVEQCFMALLSGNIDALVYPEQQILELARRSGVEERITTIGTPLQEVKRGIAVVKSRQELFRQVDAAVQQFITTARYRQIYEKWYGRPQPFWTVGRILFLTAILLAATIAAMFTWRYRSVVLLNRRLSEAKDRFRHIIEDTDAGYFRIDTEGRFQQVNAAWLRLHGYTSPEEIVGKHFAVVQADADLGSAQSNVARLLGGEHIPTGEFTRRCRDGSVGYHTFSAHPVLLGGRVIGIEGFIIDRNEYRQAEQALRKSEEKHRLLFELAGDAILIYNTGEQILAANEMAEKLLGYSHDELLSMTVGDLRSEEEMAHFGERLARLTAEGRLTFETVGCCKDGTILPIEINARLISWEEQPAIMSICRDMTLRKKAEDQARQLQKAAGLSRMAAAVAHNFNNLLAAIIGNLELALDDAPVEGDLRRDVDHAMGAALRAAEISGLMLTYLGQDIGSCRPVDLSAVCRQYLPELTLALSPGIVVETDLLPSGPLVFADPQRMQTILQHLVTNGVEAIGKGGGTIRITTGTAVAAELPGFYTAPGDWRPTAASYAVLTVEDTGCGISAEDMEQIFDPFFTTKFVGRGLGLPVILGLVKAWDGAISVSGKKDQGSIFQIVLPLYSGDENAATED